LLVPFDPSVRPVPNRKAFTLVELLVSLAVGAILVGIAMTAMAPARSAYAVRSARATFGTLVARARAQAVERGGQVFFEVDPAGDSAWIRVDTTTVEKIRFREAMGVELVGPTATVCMSARGIADPTCGSVSGPVGISFQRGGRSASATILLYGQYVLLDTLPTPSN